MMNQPVIEVVLTDIGKHTITDGTTDDGKIRAETFHTGAKIIPGVARLTYGVSQQDSETAVHLIDYETRVQFVAHKKKDFFGESIAPILTLIMKKPTTTNVTIVPCTASRRPLYASQTHVVFFWGNKPVEFAKTSPEFFSAMANSDGCLGYICGEVLNPALADPYGKMKLGGAGVLITGWRSKEEQDRDLAKPRVVEAYKAVSATVPEAQSVGLNLVVVEKSGWELKWEMVSDFDRSTIVPPAGYHEQ